MDTRPIVVLLAATLLPAQQTADLTVQQIHERAEQARVVALDEEVTATLAPDRGLRLDCAPNAFGIASVVLLFTSDDLVWVAARDVDGYAFERNSSSAHRCSAMLKQLGRTPVVIAARWSWSGDRAEVTARLSADPQRNRELFEQARAPDQGHALLLRNDAPLPVVELDEDERIAGWARLWSEVRQNFASFDRVPEVDWDAELASVLPAVRAARTPPDYYRVLARSLAKLRDGHTDVWGPGLGVQHDARLPARLEFDNLRRLCIAAVVALDAVASDAARAEIAAAGLRRGEQVTHWDGRPIDELLDAEIRPFLCASTPQGSDLRAAELLATGPHGSRVTLRIASTDSRERDVTLRRARYPIPTRLEHDFVVRELDGGVVYVNLPSFGSSSIVEQFEAELPRIRRSRALILDVRGNGGGDSSHAWKIVAHLVDRAIPTTAWRTRLYRPAYRAWGRDEEWHRGRPGTIAAAPDPFTGPVAVLVGPATFSAAEDFVAVLHAARRATVVGRPTGGSTGQPLRVGLPGGGGARVCTKRDSYPDGREFVGVGIQPDVVVDPLHAPGEVDPELACALEVLAGERR